jgi:hypothetical protein
MAPVPPEDAAEPKPGDAAGKRKKSETIASLIVHTVFAYMCPYVVPSFLASSILCSFLTAGPHRVQILKWGLSIVGPLAPFFAWAAWCFYTGVQGDIPTEFQVLGGSIAGSMLVFRTITEE